MPEVSGIVLAGGQSRRLGIDKALVRVAGVPLIDRVLGRLGQLTEDIVVVGGDPQACARPRVRLVPDLWPGMGPLGGIYSGLQAVRFGRALVVGCDMPFLDLRLLRFMILLSADYDVVIPDMDGLLEPLHAIYSRATLKPIEALLRAGDLRIVHFLGQVRVRYVDRAEIEVFDPRTLSFFNVNTPEELQRAEALAARRCPGGSR
ncbi:MAG: molybdenum cofactor guanylyltransferase [Anaerolineae bacterium]|nr:molybdenum cofactor guanylyltransferase [Anaerolineae bacterium]